MCVISMLELLHIDLHVYGNIKHCFLLVIHTAITRQIMSRLLLLRRSHYILTKNRLYFSSNWILTGSNDCCINPIDSPVILMS